MGHLDMNTGKWVDDPEEDRSIEVDDEGLARPSPSAEKKPPAPAAERSVDVGADGLVRPSEPPPPALSGPLSAIERAKLIQFVQSGKGNPTAIGVAQQMLADSARMTMAGAKPAAPASSAPAAAEPPNPSLSPGQRAVIMRARMRGAQPGAGAPLAMTNPTEGGT